MIMGGSNYTSIYVSVILIINYDVLIFLFLSKCSKIQLFNIHSQNIQTTCLVCCCHHNSSDLLSLGLVESSGVWYWDVARKAFEVCGL